MEIKFKKVALIVALICSFGILTIQAQDKVNIAVLDLEAQGGLSQQESGVLTNRLRSKLVSTNAFVMLDRGRMDEILVEQGFQLTGCTSTECAVEMGKLLNVEWIVSGAIGKIGKLYTIDIISIDIQTGQILKSLTRDYTGEIEGLISLMSSIANELAGKEEPQEEKIVTVPVKVVPEVSGIGTIEINTTPSQVMVMIDDVKLGLTPFRLDELKAGEHKLTLSKQGYVRLDQTIMVKGGENNAFNLTLDRINLISIKTNPKKATVYINGELKGTTPFKSQLATGSYTFKLKKPGFADWVQEITVSRDYIQDISLLKIYRVNFLTDPDQAEIFMNNKYIGMTPMIAEFPSGNYKVKLKRENYQDYEKIFDLRKNINISTKLKYTKEYKRQLASMKKGGGFFKNTIILAALIGGGYYYYITEIAPAESGFPAPPGRP